MTAAPGDDVENWIRRWRSAYLDTAAEWFALNDLLEDYVAHADMGVPLSEDIGLKAGWVQ